MNFYFSAIIFIINIALALTLIFLERRNPTTTWAWVLILMFVPGLGFVLYLFLGQNYRKRKRITAKGHNDMIRVARQRSEMLTQHHLDFNDPNIFNIGDLILLFYRNSGSVFSRNNKVTILNNGDEKFPALIEELRGAKHHIHMAYYIIRDDEIGRAVRDLLAQKAQEGVEVRLLYDGMGCLFVGKRYFDPIIRAGGKVAAFLPPFIPYINVRVNYRNHRKIIVIDGEIAFTGGLNLGDEYLGRSLKYGFWRDMHLMIRGSAVDQLQLRFMMDWQFASKKDIPASRKYFPHKYDTDGSGLQIVSSGPDSSWAAIHQGYVKMISRARKKVYIQTPYFVPDDSMATALKIAALGGVDVRIMIPAMPDHPFVYWASTSYIGELLEAGAKAYIYDNGFLHSKLLITDDSVASVGTANLDIRSFSMNFEVNTFIYDTDIIKKLEGFFLEDLRLCEQITPESYAARPLSMRFKESVSRLLSPLL
ncbi:MAG TPA: cardiolipin synthase [Clostridia bacterium]|nr:cardiolipin synthase [Clostridia bacterium]